MSYLLRIYQKINRKYHSFLFKRKKNISEEDFYTYLFTKNPSWNTKDLNEDETIRWNIIKKEIDKLNFDSSTVQILEIGSGRGWLSNKLSEYGNIIGIEPIQNVVNYARKLFPNIIFYVDNQTSFLKKEPSKKFDLIVSSEVIEHTHNKELFLSEVSNLLKSNGYFILTTPRLEHQNDFVKAYKIDPNQPVEEWLSELDLEEFFLKSKLKVVVKEFFAPLPNLTSNVFISQLWVVQKSKL